MQTVLFRDLGRMDYKAAWDFQTAVHTQLVTGKLQRRHEPATNTPPPHELIFVEHAPVFTLGKSGSMAHLLLDERDLAARGIQFYPINRGGDITFHGPGQIVGYPILDLEYFFTDVHRYVRNLEEIVIRTLADFGVVGSRIPSYTGVWIETPPNRDLESAEAVFFSQKRKICAIGVHLSRWVSLHGFAFNINTDLRYFDYIVPCGIRDEDKSVTSLARELGRFVEPESVKSRLKIHFADLFSCNLQEAVPQTIPAHHE
jgi:lipoyl(octanoyl) transferase